MHALEVLVILLILWAGTALFPKIANHPVVQATVITILAGAAKFVRISDSIDVPDYVNGPK